MRADGVVGASGFELSEMLDALERAGDAFVKLLRQLDAEDAVRPVPGMTWTVGETAAHMLTIIRRGLGDRRRSASIEGLAELNDQAIGEVAEREPLALATLLEQDMREYLPRLRTVPDDAARDIPVELHAGVHAELPTALSYQLFDFLAHGLDIASATRRSWTIDPASAVLTLRAALPALRPWVLDDAVAGPRQRVAFTFPGADFALVVEIGDGEYRVSSQPRDEEAAETDPVTLFLAIGGRGEATDAVAKQLAPNFRPI